MIATILRVASIGGVIYFTSKIYSARMNYARIGRGRWHAKCSFSSYLQFYYSFMPSNVNLI